MKKVILQAVIGVTLFFGTWYVLDQVDWLEVFQVEKASSKTEEKLGELYWEAIKNKEEVIRDPYVVTAVDSLIQRICDKNDIDRESIKVHLLRKDEVNAFALPNRHMVIYSGLITNSDNQEELTGVICHELAHIQLNHIMQKLVKEIGLSVLISMTTGSTGADGIQETVHVLSSAAFDRKMEKEADIKAVDYLVKAELDPEPFANFLYRIDDQESAINDYLSWLSTHPDSKERAEYIIDYMQDKTIVKDSILTQITWNKLQHKLSQ